MKILLGFIIITFMWIGSLAVIVWFLKRIKRIGTEYFEELK